MFIISKENTSATAQPYSTPIASTSWYSINQRSICSCWADTALHAQLKHCGHLSNRTVCACYGCRVLCIPSRHAPLQTLGCQLIHAAVTAAAHLDMRHTPGHTHITGQLSSLIHASYTPIRHANTACSCIGTSCASSNRHLWRCFVGTHSCSGHTALGSPSHGSACHQVTQGVCVGVNATNTQAGPRHCYACSTLAALITTGHASCTPELVAYDITCGSCGMPYHRPLFTSYARTSLVLSGGMWG